MTPEGAFAALAPELGPESLRELGSSLGRGPAEILVGIAGGTFPEPKVQISHEGSIVIARSCSTIVERKKGVVITAVCCSDSENSELSG
jgi:hypothetical protein